MPKKPLETIKEHFSIVADPRKERRAQWNASNLQPRKKLNQPGPLFKKLEESVFEEERARLGI